MPRRPKTHPVKKALAILSLAGLLVGIATPNIAQTNPPSSVQQSAELEEAKQLFQQARQLFQEGKYREAIPLAERALAIAENIAGLENTDVANILDVLAQLHYYKGNYAAAEPLHQRALAIREKALGAEHPSVATSLNNLAALYRAMGNYTAAEPLYQRSLAIREKALGTEHPSVATSLNNLAELYRAMGNYSAAEPLFQRSLAILEKALGTEHSSVATSLNNLAALYRAMGNYPAAEPLFQRSLAILEKALGADHPDVATSLNGLAGLYNSMGNYTAAEPLYQRSLVIWEKALGSDHPSVATSLNGLANLYNAMGNYAAAEPLYQRSLAIYEKALGAEHPNVATSLNNLAELYRAMGNYAAAEPLYQRSLAIREKALGADHPSVATSLNNLANLYSNMGNYAAAEPLYQRSLAIREKALGADHPDVANSLNNLANLYSNMGNYAAAEPLYQRSLNLWEKALGADHPDVATSLNNLAALYHAQNDIPRATEFLQRGVNIQENNLSLIFTTGSESEKRAYIRTLSGTTYRTISLHLQGAPNNPQAARLALTTLLRRKGRILDALTESLNLLRQNLTPENQALLDQLAAKRTQLSNLIYNKPENLPLDEYRRQVSTLKAEAEKLESELSRRSAEFRVESEPVTIEAIQALIPSDTALVEIVQYKPFDPKAPYGERFGTPRYAAYILKSTGEPQWVDLGEAEPIDNAVKQFRRGLTNLMRRSRAKKTGRALDELVMQPIRSKLGNTKNLLLSPDGQLNLIPFAALVDENEQYLVENYSITYLTTGRDLLRLAISNPAKQPPVLVANPDYDNSDSGSTVASRTPPNSRGTQPENNTSPTLPRGSNRRSANIENLTFDALPGTAAEAAAIAPLLENVNLLTETKATENAVKQVQSPSILHIATHGFFLDVDLVAPAANPLEDRSLVAVHARPGVTPRPRPPRQQENPLLRSGIVFAGFNNRSSGEEDGVLTALEVANLNLRGTQLVVLSACQTGLGEIANGEGVYGLRRALVMAGAESQAISLWRVSDEGTKDLMVKYYQRLLRGEGRSEALRQVQLEMLNGEEYSHPFFWGAFIPSGAWTAFD
ncbi:tetratricopeptide repeat protein [Lusitaniella coriacea]|uniref:CHAT domain-containing tetratricopeptide repeat protein n=1 Tax=Lusitaniella coriacea TaxID=1983105 RepID=UPI003CF52CED